MNVVSHRREVARGPFNDLPPPSPCPSASLPPRLELRNRRSAFLEARSDAADWYRDAASRRLRRVARVTKRQAISYRSQGSPVIARWMIVACTPHRETGATNLEDEKPP